MTTARDTLHLIKAAPPVVVRRLQWESEDHYAKRCAAVRALGVRWVRHPLYTYQARHSHNPDVYEPARAHFLQEIARAAAADRARNPAFHSAERVRAALGGLT